jgi:hypothetical protein
VSSATRQWWLWVPLANLASMVKEVGPPQLEGVLVPKFDQTQSCTRYQMIQSSTCFFLERWAHVNLMLQGFYGGFVGI